VATVTTHRDVGPELRKLAQAILDGIDPGVRAAAARAWGGGPGRCQQVWCPVCALAALMTGEQHPLLSVIADHSVSLLSVARALLDDLEKSGEKSEEKPENGPGSAPPEGGGDVSAPTGDGVSKSHYQPITISVEE
jgi:hypothetical protein